MVSKETKTVSNYDLNRNLKGFSSRPFMPLGLSVLLLELSVLLLLYECCLYSNL